MKKAVVLLSGGLDSATVLAMAKAAGFAVHALTFSYGQRHSTEIESARRVALALGAVEHRVLKVGLGDLGGSALTSEMDVPKDRPAHEIEQGIPITYVPARNTLFLSFALAWAEVLDSRDIFIGANHVDYSGYPDCRPAFIAAFERVANLGTKMGQESKITIHAPIIELTKAQIIRKGVELGLDYGLTHSCYDPDESGRACGRCDSCQLRRQGFIQAGVADPTQYFS